MLSSKLGILSLIGMPTKTLSFQSVINFSGPSPVGCRLWTTTLLATLHPFIHVLISQLASSSKYCPVCQSFQHLPPVHVSPVGPVCPLSVWAKGGCGAGAGRSPWCSWPLWCGHGPRPSGCLWTAEAGDVILTSSQAQHQHSPYLLSSA